MKWLLEKCFEIFITLAVTALLCSPSIFFCIGYLNLPGGSGPDEATRYSALAIFAAFQIVCFFIWRNLMRMLWGGSSGRPTTMRSSR